MYLQNERGKRTDQCRATGFGGGCHCKMTALALQALIERAYPGRRPVPSTRVCRICSSGSQPLSKA